MPDSRSFGKTHVPWARASYQRFFNRGLPTGPRSAPGIGKTGVIKPRLRARTRCRAGHAPCLRTLRTNPTPLPAFGAPAAFCLGVSCYETRWRYNPARPPIHAPSQTRAHT